ncbi:actin depolymerizing protein [Saitoella complicata NRRL Y-17804]|uniref:ADF-H domain-containing protein n=1 Tax=Saitoella complicata (strain BCRC 22490 / CBS 7301 / JCM 7358 / NBRC 10748 / NRRL Y-17804) TaxID=698492 RepID=A0A0E9NHB6_SAICN|nr:actin depolymerizing protein [Saitoella complicata NRRL Y-17804]ODQ51215.1 actin depolymerizing protein [Saitoella complicata NRRL Y-17804]GAO49277.1 hypothetical protein G7K_3429-t1 [Saitoella complicata NRRL Y-17804]
MANCSAPEIAAAYEDVRSDRSTTNWLLLDYESEKSDTLVLTSTGDGGLDEFKSKITEDGNKGKGRASFGYVRVTYKNDEQSERVKFILVIWIGESVKIMRKARMGVHTANVKDVLRSFSIEVPAHNEDDLREKDIVVRLRKAGGASYDGV